MRKQIWQEKTSHPDHHNYHSIYRILILDALLYRISSWCVTVGQWNISQILNLIDPKTFIASDDSIYRILILDALLYRISSCCVSVGQWNISQILNLIDPKTFIASDDSIYRILILDALLYRISS